MPSALEQKSRLFKSPGVTTALRIDKVRG